MLIIMYDLLRVEVNTNNQSNKVPLTYVGSTKTILNTVVMLGINEKIIPSAAIPLVTDVYGPTFDELWEYASVVGTLVYFSSNSRPDIQFAVHQCDRFTPIQ